MNCPDCEANIMHTHPEGPAMPTYYEIELMNEATEVGYTSTVVEGPHAPAGEVPRSVKAHAEHLARIFGHGTVATVSQYWHAVCGPDGVQHAHSAEIATWTSPVMALA